MASKKKHRKGKSSQSTVKKTAPKPHTPLVSSASDRPLLSIGMIFRNDIRCIEKCLNALQPLRNAIPCELVMADTGSEDGSRAVAERYADILFDFPWIKDFSAARNAVMDRCSGQWYLSVDTDEYLDPDFGQLVKFLAGKESKRYDYGYVTILNYSNFEMEKNNETVFHAARLLRMDTGHRYEGTIHESWRMRVTDPAVELLKVVFYHDGYSTSLWEEKRTRNLPLLKAAVEESPGNSNRLLQYLEAGPEPKELRKYAVLAVDLVEKWFETEPSHELDFQISPLLDVAIGAAYHNGYPEFEQWVRIARSRFPKSMRIALSASCYSAFHAFQHHDYLRCLEETKRYESALTRYNTGIFDQWELTQTFFRCIDLRNQQAIQVQKVNAYLALENWVAAWEELNKSSLAEISDMDLIQASVTQLLCLWRKSNQDPVPIFLRVWLELERDEATKNARQKRETFLVTCREAFRKTEDESHRPIHQLFAYLGGNNDLGRAGLILDTVDVDTIQQLLDSVKDWRFFPPEALNHALKFGAKLPEHFFKSKSEILSFHAGGLYRLRQEHPTELLRLWDAEFKEAITLGQTLWLFLLACAVVENINWKQDGNWEVFALFCDRVTLYMECFLNPTVCTEEFIVLQPAIIRFGWYCIQAKSAWDTNDPLEYTRWLKKALRSAPEMRDMVQFLSKRAEKLTKQQTPVSPELLALANQVRAILSAYPENHPAVLAIKQSEAYQKVAYLLS